MTSVGFEKNIFYKKKADIRLYVMFFSTFIAVSVMKNYKKIEGYETYINSDFCNR